MGFSVIFPLLFPWHTHTQIQVHHSLDDHEINTSTGHAWSSQTMFLAKFLIRGEFWQDTETGHGGNIYTTEIDTLQSWLFSFTKMNPHEHPSSCPFFLSAYSCCLSQQVSIRFPNCLPPCHPYTLLFPRLTSRVGIQLIVHDWLDSRACCSMIDWQ